MVTVGSSTPQQRKLFEYIAADPVLLDLFLDTLKNGVSLDINVCVKDGEMLFLMTSKEIIKSQLFAGIAPDEYRVTTKP